MVVDLDLGPEPKVLVVALGAVEHRRLARPDDRAIDDFPLAFVCIAAGLGPAAQRRAVKKRDPAVLVVAPRRDEPDEPECHDSTHGDLLDAIHGSPTLDDSSSAQAQ